MCEKIPLPNLGRAMHSNFGNVVAEIEITLIFYRQVDTLRDAVEIINDCGIMI